MIRLAVRCRPELAERVLADLLDLAPGGVEEERAGDFVEYAIYGPPGELPELPDLEAAAGEGLVEITSTRDPRRLGRPLAGLPRARRRRRRPGRCPPVVGGACGRGCGDRHPDRPRAGVRHRCPCDDPDVPRAPARACRRGRGPRSARRPRHGLRRAGDRGGEARASRRSAPATPRRAAVEAAGENAAANGVELELERLNLRERPAARRPDGRREPDRAVADDDRRAASIPGTRTVVCSGLLTTEAERVGDAFARAGFGVERRRDSGDWSALLARRDHDGSAE